MSHSPYSLRFSASAAIVLLYHRVAEPACDPQLLCVSPGHFAEHLAVLRERLRPIGLSDLSSGDVPPGSVAVTFDDGYADNLEHAKPCLQQADISATVFVTTGYVDTDREFWWDELERIFLQPGRLPDTLQVHSAGQTREWSLAEATDYDAASYERWRTWDVTQTEAPSPRQYAYRGLCWWLKSMTHADRCGVMRQVRAWAGTNESGRASHRVMTREEIVVLADGGLIDIGAHTVTHTPLALMPREMQIKEITRSKSTLETILDRPVTALAYPFGTQADYSTESIGAVKQAGFPLACANHEGTVGPETSRFELPRFIVRDWDGDAFARQLHRWLGDAGTPPT